MNFYMNTELNAMVPSELSRNGNHGYDEQWDVSNPYTVFVRAMWIGQVGQNGDVRGRHRLTKCCFGEGRRNVCDQISTRQRSFIQDRAPREASRRTVVCFLWELRDCSVISRMAEKRGQKRGIRLLRNTLAAAYE